MGEMLGLCFVVTLPLLAGLIMAASPIIIAGGIIGLLSNRKRRGELWKVSILLIVAGVGPLLVYGILKIIPDPSGPIHTPVPIYRLSDEAVKPFFKVINQSNRLSLGFSPIPSDANVEIEYYDYNNTAYAQAYIYTGVQFNRCYSSWTVYFEKDGDAYIWIGEDETYARLNRDEHIFIRYSIKDEQSYFTQRDFMPAKILIVEYRGEDHRLTKPNLTLGDVRPILEEWEKEWETRELEK